MQPLIFDFRLRQRLHSPGHTFSLDIACQSSAKRIAVVGASGSGKSLALRLLAGLEPLQEGHVRIRDVCYADTAEGINLPPQKRRVGLMFQDYALFPHLTVAQNIAFGLHKNLAQPPKAACTQTASTPANTVFKSIFNILLIKKPIPRRQSAQKIGLWMRLHQIALVSYASIICNRFTGIISAAISAAPRLKQAAILAQSCVFCKI